MTNGQSTVADRPTTFRSPQPEPRGAEQRGEGTSFDEYGEPRGYGWVIFAGIMMMIAGTINFIYGIAAISNSHVFVANANYVISDLNTWGWVVMLLGVLQFCVAFGIWVQAGWARWTGVVIAGFNAIAQLIFLPAYPFLALTVFTLDLLVIYGLAAHGGRTKEA